MEPAWKRLVEELRGSGYRSVYLDRLRERMRVDVSQDDLKREILREMASALGRSEDKVNLALLRLELLEREIERAEEADPASVDEKIEAYNRQRHEAERFLWELTIHREALGFRRNEILREYYPIPPVKLKRAA